MPRSCSLLLLLISVGSEMVRRGDMTGEEGAEGVVKRVIASLTLRRLCTVWNNANIKPDERARSKIVGFLLLAVGELFLPISRLVVR